MKIFGRFDLSAQDTFTWTGEGFNVNLTTQKVPVGSLWLKAHALAACTICFQDVRTHCKFQLTN